jgi:NADP-dependent 3-hydroxy acid dehydrogenase YdfG
MKHNQRSKCWLWSSGIGRALAASLVEHGCFVIAVGRRQDLLDSFVQEHGADTAASFKLDISKLDAIPDFVKRYVVSSAFHRICL